MRHFTKISFSLLLNSNKYSRSRFIWVSHVSCTYYSCGPSRKKGFDSITHSVFSYIKKCRKYYNFSDITKVETNIYRIE